MGKVGYTLMVTLKVVGSDRGGGEGAGKLANVQRWFRIVAIDVCFFFLFVVVFSLTYFRFRLVKPS